MRSFRIADRSDRNAGPIDDAIPIEPGIDAVSTVGW